MRPSEKKRDSLKMKNRNRTAAASGALAVFLFAGLALADIVDKIAVVVNDEVITLSEVDSAVAPLYEKYKMLYTGEELAKKVDETRQRVIDQLIEQKLLLGAAKRENVEVSDRDVEEHLSDVKKGFSSTSDFERALKADNLTLAKLKARYKEQIMVKRFIEKKAVSRVSVSPSEIDEYYKAHEQEFDEPESVKLSAILIRVKDSPEDNQKAAELARELLKRLKNGEDFALLAREYSEDSSAQEGGAMGYARKGDLMKDIDEAVFNAKPGEVTEIIQTVLGYHIFKVEEKAPPKKRDLSEVRKQVEDRIFHEKVTGAIKSLVKELKKNAYIAFR